MSQARGQTPGNRGQAPLSGIRVVDLSRLLPGAFATLMLAELGADVIKIEDPRGGDPMRQLPPILNGRGIYDYLLNPGKRSVAPPARRYRRRRRGIVPSRNGAPAWRGRRAASRAIAEAHSLRDHGLRTDRTLR